MTNKKSKLTRYLKLAGKIMLGILLLFFVLVLIIRSPWGQNLIIGKIASYVSGKTDTKITIERAFITFSGDIQLEGVFLEDQKGDTLFYSKSLQADIPIVPIAFDNKLTIDYIASDGIVANISRGDNPDEFNFSFLIDAFASQTDTETTSDTEPMEISLGEFDFKNWKLTYTDAYLGSNVKLALGSLNLDMDKFDQELMQFSVDDFSLDDTQISYEQTHAFPENNDTTSTTSPFLKVADFNINDVQLSYISKPDALDTQLNLGTITLTDILANVSKNRYETDDLIIKNSQFSIKLNDKSTPAPVTAEKTPFVWPDFILATKNLELADNKIMYTVNGTSQVSDTFDPNAFDIQIVKLDASDFEYRPKNVHLDLTDFTFTEPSGIHLDQLAFEAGITDTNASISGLALKINQSTANADFNIDFKSVDDAFKSPQKSSLSASISNLVLNIADVQQLVPELKQNEYINALAEHSLKGSLNAKGNLKKVNDFQTQLTWGANTKIAAKGTLSSLTNTDSLQYNLNTISLKSVKKDLSKFISSKDLSISIPETLLVSGSLSGGTTWVNPDMTITIPEGNTSINALVDFGEDIRFNGGITVDSLQLGKLLQNEQLGSLSLQLEGEGAGTDVATMNANIKGSITQFQLNGYSYERIELDGELKNGSGTVVAGIKDPNLNVTANTVINLTTDITDIKLTSKIIGADLKNLGFTKNDIKIAAEIDGSYLGSPSNYTIKTTIGQGIAVADNEQYQIDPILLRAHIEDSITDVSVASGFINGDLYSNASPARINTALKQQLEHYFTTDSVTQVSDSVKAKLKFSVKPIPILDKVFFNGITDLDSLNIDADFDSKAQRLYAEVKVPKISCAGSSVDSLNVLLNGDASDLNFSAGLGNLLYEPVHLKQTYLEGSLKNKELVLDFNAKNDSVQVMHITSELKFQKDTLRLHIDPEELILNKKKWEIPNDNSIVLADSFTDLRNLILSRKTQKLEVFTKVPKMEQEHIGVLFENFELQTFLSLFNPDEALAKGKVQGDLVFLNPFGASGLVSDIQIEKFEVFQNPLGTLALNASSNSFSDYDFDLALRDGDAKLSLTGDYVTTEDDAKLNMELDIKEVKTSVIQGFLKDQLSNPKGYISGSMLVNGTLSDPKYSGILNFTDTELTLTQFNTALSMNGQSLDLNQDEITFSNFSVTDNSKGDLVLDGKITTKNISNPGFNLSIKADKFRVLNSKKGDNELVYGIASINADVNVAGDLELPVINGKLRVRDVTDLTYVVPQEQLDIQERDGVVIFVNKENPDAILTRNERQSSNSVFAGMDISTTLEISNDAKFTVVLDEKTQDMLQASGEAALKLNIDPNSDIRLSGRLELNSGFYKTSLYNLVSREFQIKKGSNIVWGGDPYDAKLDVTAIYEIETSPSPLMSSISAGQDSNVSGSYQQAADFMVYLNVEGQLTEPELSFGLDMPENEQGNFGGAVYGRIQQLNEQESELNKQVFSLLALNRFYPTSGSDGSSGGAMSLARNNVNKVLSSELNAISDKLLGNSGFELGFDLDSFEDYETGTAQSRTQLNINASKKLFNDRLIVTAGSALDVEGSAATEDSATPIIGNVTLEYLLSEEGTYRLKGFRKQEYQNIIDGQLIVTGIAFIFNREFNKFSQLFSPIKKEERKAKKDNKSKKDADKNQSGKEE